MPNYSNDDILRISRNMQEFGGSFAKYIGKALLVADSDNRARLEQAFPELLEKYFKFWSSLDIKDPE